VITYGEIAASSPSDVTGMSKHLLTNTLGMEEAKLCAYYQRGGDAEVASQWYSIAQAVMDGETDWTDAVRTLMEPWYKTWDRGDADTELRVQSGYENRLSAVIERIEKGLAFAPLAIVRPDIEAGVMIGLGIMPGMILTEQEINNLLAGRMVNGDHIEGKHYAVERSMPVNSKTGERRWSTPIGSYDFTATPDKTVSVAWAFASKVEQARIFMCHQQAAREAVGYIADEIGIARFGKAGMSEREAGAVAWLEFVHHTSRRIQMVKGKGNSAEVEDLGIAGDPNLHTHFLIPNAVFTGSGRVGSLDTMGIRGLIKEAGAFYQARLGTLLREAGFDAVLDQKTGSVRMPVVPEPVRAHYSKKTNQGEEEAKKEVAAQGRDWDTLSLKERTKRTHAATQRVETKRKDSKGQKDDVADWESWRPQAKDIGWDIPQAMKLIGPPLRELTKEERHRTAYELSMPWLAEQFEYGAVQPHFVLRRGALRGLVHTGMDDLSDVDAVTKIMRQEGIVQNGVRTALVWGQEDEVRHVSVTTRLHEEQEIEFIGLMRAAAADKSGAIPAALLARSIDESGLDFSDAHGKAQRAAIERVGLGGQFTMIVAAAGAGKTTALKPLIAAREAMGWEVWGTSLSSRQSHELAGAGIDERHVRAVGPLLETIKAGVLGPKSMLAVDEYGLLGTRQMLDLLRYQERDGFTIVTLGDPKQCASIEAGSGFDLATRALGAENIPVIATTRRQRGREAEISHLLREGEAAQALSMKREDGRAEMVYGGANGVILRAAALYRERLAATGHAPAMSAPTNADAHQVSAAVRDEKREMGLIGNDLVRIPASDGERAYQLSLAKGDLVRLFRAAGATYEAGGGGPIGYNGSVLTVLDASATGVVVQNAKGKIGSVKWDKLRDETGRILLAYGDCMTVHSAQGSDTLEHIMVLPRGSQAITGYTGYSAVTRHKERAYLLTSADAEERSVRESRPINSQHEITIEDRWASVAKALTYKPEQDSALAMMERVRQVHRGAVSSSEIMREDDLADPRTTRPVPEHAPQAAQERSLEVEFERAREATRYFEMS